MSYDGMNHVPWQMAASPINWCNDDLLDLGAQYEVETIWQEMTQAGVQGTEMGRKYTKDAATLSKQLQAFGLTLASGWGTLHLADRVHWQESLRRYQEHVAFLAEMGCSVAVTCEGSGSVHWDRGGDRSQVIRWDDAAWKAVAEGLNQAGERAFDLGVRLVYHPHLGTNVESPEDIDRLMDMTHPEWVSLCLDTGHVAAAGGDPVNVFDAYHDRVRHLHLKDIRPSVVEAFHRGLGFLAAVRRGIFTVPGDGALDFYPLLERLARANYSGWLVIEAEQDPDLAPPLPHLQQALAYLDGFGREEVVKSS
jgi:inosose dehydratase